jgi:molybdopterin/thiamine biosynthesis adenylyltransferase
MISRLEAVIDVKAYVKLKEFLSEPPEVCGPMKVGYLQCGYYTVLDFKRKEYERSGGHCVPGSALGWRGVWHTHSPGFGVASSTDSSSMVADAEAASKGDTPGIPPVHLIASKAERGVECSIYFPTFRLRYKPVKLAESVRFYKHVSTASSLDPLLENFDHDVSRMFNFSAMKTREGESGYEAGGLLPFAKVYEVEEFLPLTRGNAKDSDGVFIGASTPPHAVPVILKFFAENSGRKSFLVYLEDFKHCGNLAHGLYEIEVEGFEPCYIPGTVKVLDLGFGVENRVKRLKDEHGIDLLGLRRGKVALFGVGFVGTRLLARLSKMFDEITIVDYDAVGEENVSYQELYTVEDVGLPKVLAASRRALQAAPLSRIYLLNSEIPSYPHPPSELVESVVGWCDVAVTTFDSLLPRITVQLACNKLSKPLIDIGVGPQDAEIRVWYRRDKACIACYMTGLEALPPRTPYASDPRIADLASDVAAVYVERILTGRDVPSVTKVDVNLGVVKRDYARDEQCPVCAPELQTELGSFKPWDKIGKSVKLKRGESTIVLKGGESASFLKYLERLGYSEEKF